MTSIGKYQVLEELGRGSTGITYRARDRFLGRELALKVLYSGDGTAGEAQERFQRELAASAELRHPNILRIYDAGEVEGAIYIAAELLSGADLGRQQRQVAALPLSDKIELIAQVCDGLAYAHRNGITHGDVKPSNIFLTADKRPVLLDLGLISGPRLGAQAAGTAEYRSPEQVARQAFDVRCDVFSAAVIAYELLANVHPFPGGWNDIQNAEPRPPRAYEPRIPAALEALLLRALEKDPQRRLRAADELAAGLRAAAKELQYSQAMADIFSQAEPRGVSSQAAPAAPELVYPPPPAHDTAFAPPALISTASPRFTPVDSAQASGAPVLRQAPQPSGVPQAPLAGGAAPSDSDTLARQVLAEMRQMASVDATYSAAAFDLETRLTHLTGSHSAAPPVPASIPAPQARLQTAPPAISRVRRIALLATAALVALAIGLGIVAHQKTQAAQAPRPAQITPVPQVSTPAVAPMVQQNTLTELPPAPVAQSAPAAAPERPTAERTLRVQVNSLYQAGRYAQAMKLVDDILADEPENAQARAWKQRIRAAEDAEAAFR